MTPFEYVLPLVSIIVGLAVADLAISLHRLLRARRRIRWDWIPLAGAALALLTVLNMWWGLYAYQEDPFYRTFLGFLPLAAQLTVLFLISSAALPDDVAEAELDLRTFYEANGPYFWTLYAVYVLLVTAHLISGYLTAGWPGSGAAAMSLGPNLILAGVFVTLARVRARALHAVVLVVLLGLFLAQWSRLSLGAS